MKGELGIKIVLNPNKFGLKAAIRKPMILVSEKNPYHGTIDPMDLPVF